MKHFRGGERGRTGAGARVRAHGVAAGGMGLARRHWAQGDATAGAGARRRSRAHGLSERRYVQVASCGGAHASAQRATHGRRRGHGRASPRGPWQKCAVLTKIPRGFHFRSGFSAVPWQVFSVLTKWAAPIWSKPQIPASEGPKRGVRDAKPPSRLVKTEKSCHGLFIGLHARSGCDGRAPPPPYARACKRANARPASVRTLRGAYGATNVRDRRTPSPLLKKLRTGRRDAGRVL